MKDESKKKIEKWAAVAVAEYDQERAKLEHVLQQHLESLSADEVLSWAETLDDNIQAAKALHARSLKSGGYVAHSSLLQLYGTLEAQRLTVNWCLSKCQTD